MTDSKHTPKSDAMAEEDGIVSRAYRKSSAEQSPEQVDDAILAAGRRAVKSRPGFACVPGRSSWQGPVSIAAVLVLSVSLVFTLQQQTGEEKPGDRAVTLYEDDAVAADTEKQIVGESVSNPSFAPNRSADIADTAAGRSNAGTGKVMSPPAQVEFMKKSVPGAASEVEMLRDEITVLQHDQRVLEQEKTELKREIAQVEARQQALQREVSGLDIGSGDVRIEGSRAQVAWLSYIRNLLKDSADSLARSNLRDFHLAHPDYPRDTLEQVLPVEFVKAVLGSVPDDS